MNYINQIINEDRKDYKCFSLLKKLLNENEEFKNIVKQGVELGKIKGFSEELWKEIYLTDVPKFNSFEDIFELGYNIGTCTTTSTFLSYALNYCEICGGTLPLIKGTNNSPDGRHTWILYQNNIIDTSLMLIIDEKYAKKLNYITENQYNPAQDIHYYSARDFARNNARRKESIRKK